MLEDELIFLRRIDEGDAPVLLQWGQDELYHDAAGFEKISDLDFAKKAAQRYSQRPYSYAIVLKENNQMVGLVELYERGRDAQAGLLETKDLGFLLSKKYWHQGIMTRALTLLINYTFNELKQNQIWAGVFPSNERSQHLLQKLGFRYVYSTDYSQISDLFDFKEKYFVLTPKDWYDTMHVNTKS